MYVPYREYLSCSRFNFLICTIKVVTMQMAASGVLGNRVGGFQKYAIAIANLTALIPSGVSFEEAATIPVTATTTLAAFHSLSLPWPTTSERIKIDDPILVWGGGSGVGRTAIAFLHLAGYRNIITTAAIKRENELKNIGASTVIDHHDQDIIQTLSDALHGNILSKAIDAVTKPGTTASIVQLMKNGGKIARVTPLNPGYDENKDIEMTVINCAMFHNVSYICLICAARRILLTATALRRTPRTQSSG